jgi:hypothetical protein
MYEKLKAYNEKHGHCKVPIEAMPKILISVFGLWVYQKKYSRQDASVGRICLTSLAFGSPITGYNVMNNL